MTNPLPHSIPDSQLGLSTSEIHLLRQHQQIALSSSINQQQQAYAHSTASTRGRGHARTSASTSRATSAASSQPGNRLVLDPGSLALLGQHFERLMGAIQSRVESVCAARLFFAFWTKSSVPLLPFFPRHSSPSLYIRSTPKADFVILVLILKRPLSLTRVLPSITESS